MMVMDVDRFNTYIDGTTFVNARQYILDNGLCCQFAKGDYLIRQGAVCNRFGVITKGYFKYTVMNSAGEESVVNFAFEDDFVVDFRNSLTPEPSEVSIIAGSECEIRYVHVSEIKKLFVEDCIESACSIYKSLYGLVYARILDLHRYSPKERYLMLVDRYPRLIQTVTLKDIAAYLLITPNHLSRLRREIAKGR